MLLNLSMIGVLVVAGAIPNILNTVLATSIVCPNAPRQGDYALCSESYDSSFKVGKQAKNLMDSEENARTQAIYCTPDIDVAIVDTSIGGDSADIVCETRSNN